MKLLEVFRYELEHQLHKPSTWAYALLILAFAVANAVDVGPLDAVNANAPLQIAYDAALTGMLGLAVSAALFGDAALRDIEAGMDPLLFTSPQRTLDHLGGRYLAALTVNALLLLAVPLGYALPTLIGYPDPAHFGPFRIAAVLEPWLFMLLPNMALGGAVLFAVAVVSRRLTPVYITGFVCFMGALFLADIAGNRLDPSGIGALASLRGFPNHEISDGIRRWTAADQNSRLISSSPELLWNRLLWLAVTGVVLALLHRYFRFTHVPARGAPAGRAQRERHDAPDAAGTVPLRPTRATASFGVRTAARQTLSIARTSLVEAAANPWFAGVLVVSALWCVSLVEKTTERPFDVTTWPATMLVTAAFSRDFLVGLFLLVGIYAGELVWKDRDTGVSEIIDAAPVAEGAQLAGRLLALVAMGAMFLAASMIGGILAQIGHDYYDVEPGLYARVLFGMNLAEIALMAMLLMTIHVLVNHKYLGIVAALIALVIPFTGPMLGHDLLVYDGDAGWIYSDMNGFGPFLTPFVWLKLYSAAWAVLLAVVAWLLWVRGRESGMQHRIRQARARFTGPVRRTAAVAGALILLIGGFIFYNTNVLNAFDADADAAALHADYVKRYDRFADVPQPRIERARLRVEIHPGEQALDLGGAFQLVNRTGAPIDSIHVSTAQGIVTRSISFDREATPVVMDTAVGYRIYALARPLAPGDSMQLSFDVGFRQRGFRNSAFQTDVVGNGTYVGRGWLPFVGYQPARARSSFGARGEGNVRVDATIGTRADQVAITAGVLRREWTENGRRYFHYETETPEAFEFPVFSGRYSVHSDRWNDPSAGSGRGVALSVYHHPDHDRNLDSFVRSMKASLAYYTAQFGPYDADELRIVEVPRYHREVRTHPTIIAFSEGRFIAHVKEGQIDELFFGTAHEIAHHWWVSVDTGGSQGVLPEAIADYSALMVTEQEYGTEAARRVYASRMERYFDERASASTDATSEASIAGLRHMLAMYLMRDYIGDQVVNTALRRVIDRHRAGTAPHPTARDVVGELRAVTPDSLRYLLTDLFETATMWDVKTDRAVVEPVATGGYRVTLDVAARKTRADGAGKETEVPMDDVIEIGVFAPVSGSALGEPLYLKRHRIRSGTQTISITVPGEPARAGIDPYRTLIDRSGGDNVVPIAGGTEVRSGGR